MYMFSMQCLPFFALEPPKLIKGFTDVVKNQSDSVTFRCSFEGVPAPSIEWYIQDIAEVGNGMLESPCSTDEEPGSGIPGKFIVDDGAIGVLIKNSTRVSIKKTIIKRNDSLEESQSTLTISSVDRSSDEGLYTCRGKNDVENILETVTAACATLTVYGKLHEHFSIYSRYLVFLYFHLCTSPTKHPTSQWPNLTGCCKG